MSGPAARPPVEKAHRLVKLLHELCAREMISRNELARRAGLSDSCLQNWWDAQGAIVLQNVEAALGVFGYGLRHSEIVSEPDPLLRAGETYRTRCGDFAYIDEKNEGGFIGRHAKYGLVLRWTLAGEAIPRGGESPYDLVTP